MENETKPLRLNINKTVCMYQHQQEITNCCNTEFISVMLLGLGLGIEAKILALVLKPHALVLRPGDVYALLRFRH